MNKYALSEAADADMADIARKSVTQWGFARAERYLRDLHEAFEMLGEFPHMGRNAGHVRPGYFRFDHDSHSIYYQKTDVGIFVVRVLHEKQQPKNYL